MMIGSVRYEVVMSDYRDEMQWLTPSGDHKSEMTMGD